MTSTGRRILLPADVAAVVRRLVDLLPVDAIDWALTGSVAHTLAGVAVDLGGDVDVQTDEAGAYEVEERLPPDAMVEPVHLRESARIRSHFGRAVLDGVPVEIMGAMQQRQGPSDAWSPPVDPADHRMVVQFGDVRVPVLDLAHEAEAYALMGRPDRAAALRRAAGLPGT